MEGKRWTVPWQGSESWTAMSHSLWDVSVSCFWWAWPAISGHACPRIPPWPSSSIVWTCLFLFHCHPSPWCDNLFCSDLVLLMEVWVPCFLCVFIYLILVFRGASKGCPGIWSRCVLDASPKMPHWDPRRYGEWLGTCWRDYVSPLIWECLEVPPEELEEVARGMGVWPSLLKFLPPDPIPDKR